MTAKQAVKKYINNSDMVFVGGFGHAIPFAIAQEIVRQKICQLHLVKTGADIVFDMLVASGCAQSLTCGWYGNPGIGVSYIISQAVASGKLKLTESTNFSMMLRLHAGKLGIPFIPSPILSDGDLADSISEVKSIICPFSNTKIKAHGALNPDVAINCDDAVNNDCDGLQVHLIFLEDLIKLMHEFHLIARFKGHSGADFINLFGAWVDRA